MALFRKFPKNPHFRGGVILAENRVFQLYKCVEKNARASYCVQGDVRICAHLVRARCEIASI